MYAIIETGGKQYKVTLGELIDVERLNIAEGNSVELDKVLLIADGEKVIEGKPVIEGAKVIATSRGENKDEKIVVFRYKAKTRYQKKTGHRQIHTRLSIDKILSPGLVGEPVKKARRKKKEVVEDGA